MENYTMVKIDKVIHQNFKGLASLKGKGFQEFINEALRELWETKYKKELIKRGQ